MQYRGRLAQESVPPCRGGWKLKSAIFGFDLLLTIPTPCSDPITLQKSRKFQNLPVYVARGTGQKLKRMVSYRLNRRIAGRVVASDIVQEALADVSQSWMNT